jgi:hypothetical protein
VFAADVVLNHHVASGTASEDGSPHLDYFVGFGVLDLEDAVPWGSDQVLMGKFAGLAAAEVGGLEFLPCTHAAIAEVSVFAVEVRASYSIAVRFVHKGLMTFGTALQMLLGVVFRKGIFEVLLLLGSKDSYLLANTVVPLEPAFATVFQLKRTPDDAFVIGDDGLDMSTDASLSDIMSTWPLVGILLTVDGILNVSNEYLADLIQTDPILPEGKNITNSYDELHQPYVIVQLLALVGELHLVDFEFLA